MGSLWVCTSRSSYEGVPWLWPWPWPWWSEYIYSELNRKFPMKSIIKSNKNIPWTTNALRIFKPNPVHAMIRTRRGESTGCIFIKRSIDCKQMDNAKANRKTPLKNAPVKQSWVYGPDTVCTTRFRVSYRLIRHGEKRKWNHESGRKKRGQHNMRFTRFERAQWHTPS